MSTAITPRLPSRQALAAQRMLARWHFGDPEPRGFPAFVAEAWPHVHARHGAAPIGMRGKLLPRVLHAVAIHVEAWIRGDIDCLLVNFPPGLGKSIVANVLAAAWAWALDPSDPMMFGSYSEDPSERDSDLGRRFVGGEWYQRHFVGANGRPAWKITKDTTSRWENDAGGSRMIVTRTGQGTGFRARRIVIDDGIKVIEGTSEAALNETRVWLGETLWTRNLPGEPVKMMIIGQRVVDNDPSGWAIGTGKFVHLCLPAEYEPDRHCTTCVIDPETGQPWTDWRSEPGELLCPELHSAEYLAGQKAILGAGYFAQYQQDPVDPNTAMFPLSGWRFWRYEDEPELSEADRLRLRPKGCWQGPAIVLPPRAELLKVISVDAAFKKNPNSDRVSITVWARSREKQRKRRFLLDRDTRQMSFVESVRAIRKMAEKWPDYHLAMLELRANGDAIENVLREEGDMARLNPPEVKELVNPTDDKKTRAAAGAPEQQGGEWYLHDGAEYLGEFTGEHFRFPKGRKDDDVDSTSAANTYLRGSAGQISAEERLKKLATW